ncbi:hypothetical protein KKF34_10990 [Myxococcota bacterium]|nr:hypothetical protein [Myxococcota bacterium]MBU1379924.1 hypothetical protein [Myxococcota bacterium]MBU1497391.1 hypothetical protein [Myxococcota bacterium]
MLIDWAAITWLVVLAHFDQGFRCAASLTPGYSKMVSFHDVRVPGKIARRP